MLRYMIIILVDLISEISYRNQSELLSHDTYMYVHWLVPTSNPNQFPRKFLVQWSSTKIIRMNTTFSELRANSLIGEYGDHLRPGFNHLIEAS